MVALVCVLLVFDTACDQDSTASSSPVTTSAPTRGEQRDVKPALPPATRASARVPVPILMYHVIAEPPADAPHPALFVSPEDLAGQLAWLDRHGFEAVTQRAVWDSWHGGSALPAHPIVLSFDDGYRSAVSAALPALARYEWPGVLNLTFDHVGSSGLRPRGVRRLIAAGWEIDAHSLSHADLTTLDGAELTREVAGSRAAIRRTFDVPVDFFCFPSGRYDADVIESVRRAGYLGATTTEHGLARADEPFTLDRVRVEGSDGVDGVAEKLGRLAQR